MIRIHVSAELLHAIESHESRLGSSEYGALLGLSTLLASGTEMMVSTYHPLGSLRSFPGSYFHFLEEVQSAAGKKDALHVIGLYVRKNPTEAIEKTAVARDRFLAEVFHRLLSGCADREILMNGLQERGDAIALRTADFMNAQVVVTISNIVVSHDGTSFLRSEVDSSSVSVTAAQIASYFTSRIRAPADSVLAERKGKAKKPASSSFYKRKATELVVHSGQLGDMLAWAAEWSHTALHPCLGGGDHNSLRSGVPSFLIRARECEHPLAVANCARQLADAVSCLESASGADHEIMLEDTKLVHQYESLYEKVSVLRRKLEDRSSRMNSEPQ
eukprot:ANDGO_05094.mRNA.1 hypothetical protein